MAEKICEAMALVAEYALKKGWAPIGDRTFTVGDWEVRVNGTKQMVDGIPPYNARAINNVYMGIMIFSPYGGSCGGWKDTETEFVAAMKKAIEEA